MPYKDGYNDVLDCVMYNIFSITYIILDKELFVFSEFTFIYAFLGRPFLRSLRILL